MSILKTGDIFQAKNKLGEKYFYRFLGVDLDDSAGCYYIVLQNLCFNEKVETRVEHAWFRERDILKLQPGMEVRKGDVFGVITPMRYDFLARADCHGFDLAGKLRVEITEVIRGTKVKVGTIWDYNEIELV